MTSAWSMTTWLVSTRSNAASPKAVWFGRWIPFINCSISRSLNYPKWCRISCINREMSLKQNMFGSSFALFRPEPLWFHLGSTSCSQPFHNHPGPNHLDRICNCTIYKRKMKLREYSSSSEWFSYKLVDCLCSVTQSLPHTTSPSQTSFLVDGDIVLARTSRLNWSLQQRIWLPSIAIPKAKISGDVWDLRFVFFGKKDNWCDTSQSTIWNVSSSTPSMLLVGQKKSCH